MRGRGRGCKRTRHQTLNLGAPRQPACRIADRVLGMAEPSLSADEQAALEELFASRPRSEEEIRARLASVDAAKARRWMLARLRRVGAPPRFSATMVGALRMLGLGDRELPALVD